MRVVVVVVFCVAGTVEVVLVFVDSVVVVLPPVASVLSCASAGALKATSDTSVKIAFLIVLSLDLTAARSISVRFDGFVVSSKASHRLRKFRKI